jgi:hypothetical protein
LIIFYSYCLFIMLLSHRCSSCDSTDMMQRRVGGRRHNGDLVGIPPVGMPHWNSTYNAQLSTIFMPCNNSGYFNSTFVSTFGIADFDWSNAKQIWANTQPMTCEEDLVTQAETIKAASSQTKVFVYRNLVKALPWFTAVREKIMDPAYSGWFLSFSGNGSYHVPQCDTNFNPPRCSNFYHDQEQTPAYPSGDGTCYEPCDCGEGVPCGEYLWNHANGTMLRQWLINEHILGPTGLGNPNIDGFYIDDAWWSFQQPIQSWEPPTGFCDHWITGGATEEDYYCVDDVGLTQEQVTDITFNWYTTMVEAALAIREHHGWAWFLFLPSRAPDAATCTQYFRTEGRLAINGSLLFEWTSSGSYPLPNIDVDVASFLLVRGEYAWLGYGWQGCTSNEQPGFGSAQYTSPVDIPQLMVDYGVPMGEYEETSDGVFTRDWTKATVSMDCNTYTPQIIMKQ